MLKIVEINEPIPYTCNRYMITDIKNGVALEAEMRICMSDIYIYMIKPYYNIDLSSSHIPYIALQFRKYYEGKEITAFGYETIEYLLKKIMDLGDFFNTNKEMVLEIINDYNNKLKAINEDTNLLHEDEYKKRKIIGRRLFKDGLLTQTQYQHNYLKTLIEQFESCERMKSDLRFLYDKKIADLTNNDATVSCELFQAAIDYFYPENKNL